MLLRSADPIPGASRSLTYLQRQHIPFILLTNGGGKHESERVSDISASLSLSPPLTAENFIQSHTPIADFLHSFPHATSNRGLSSDATILVVGGESDKCRLVAESYGFKRVLVPGDIYSAYPSIWPLSHVFNSYYSAFAKPVSSPDGPASASPDVKIDAIFIFNDPRDWALDIQLILDILLSDSGVIGTISKKNGDRSLPNRGYQQDNQPPLYFSNSDLFWAASYHLPRLGQGGFQHAFEGVWRRVTGGAQLNSTVLGKPSSMTYSFAEKRLNQYRRDLVVQSQSGNQQQDLRPLKKVYMVGDNPESDIKGSNNYRSPHKTDWVSVLVKTGVFTEGQEQHHFDATPELKPRVTVDDVRAAVDWGLKDSGWVGAVG